jgi:hypothetical protein
METTLHRQLKEHYAGASAQTEVRIGRFRIDAVASGELIEIQHGSLAAIRDKIRTLLKDYRVRVVKPIVAAKLLVKRSSRNGRVVERRSSPKQGCPLDLFAELVYFTRVFGHPNLTLDVPLVEIEQWRYPGHGRRRRRRTGDFVVEDEKLIAIRSVSTFACPHDLLTLLPEELPAEFDTGELAARLKRPRWMAQRIAYCLRQTGALEATGKRGNAWRYAVAPPRAQEAA